MSCRRNSGSARRRVAGLVIGILLCALCEAAAPIHLVKLNMSVTLDQVARDRPELQHMTVGQVDRLRIVYDANALDPRTHRVALLNFQHRMSGRYVPAKPDPVAMPMTDAWLDLSERPYRMHLKAAVVHGTPIIIEVDEHARRLTIRTQDLPQRVLITGLYVIDPQPVTGR